MPMSSGGHRRFSGPIQDDGAAEAEEDEGAAAAAELELWGVRGGRRWIEKSDERLMGRAYL